MPYSPRKQYTKKQPPMAVAKAIARARAGEVNPVKYGDPVATKTELKSAAIKIGPAQADSFSFEAVKDKFHRIPANEEEHAYYYEFELTKQSDDTQEFLSTVTKASVRRMFVTNVEDYFTEKMAKRVKKKINGDVSKVHIEMLPNFRLNLNILRDGFSTKLTQTRDNTPLPSKHWLTPAVCVVTFCVSIRYGEDSVRSHITAQRFGLKNSLKTGNYDQVNPVPEETDDTAEDFLRGSVDGGTVDSSSDSDTENQTSSDENGVDQQSAFGASKDLPSDVNRVGAPRAAPLLEEAASTKLDAANEAQDEAHDREHVSSGSSQLPPSTGAVMATSPVEPGIEGGESSLLAQETAPSDIAISKLEPPTKPHTEDQDQQKGGAESGFTTPLGKKSTKATKKRGRSNAPVGNKSKMPRGGGKK